MRFPSKKQNSYSKGIWAEYYAAVYLCLKGYRICAMRYKTQVGEIDLVARKGKAFVFIEVKYRADITQALSAVHPKAQIRIRRAAEQYLQSKNQKESFTLKHEIRFDVIGITPKLLIRHIWNAF